MDEPLCSTREAAAVLGICVRTAQLWVERGRLRAWKTPGGHRRILRESVNAELRAREAACGNAPQFDVLVVEDERMQRQLLQTGIAALAGDIVVRTAADGIEGLLKIGERQPQILITDLSMPGVDGFQLLATLTSDVRMRLMRIIVLTGMSEAEIQAKGGLPEGVVLLYKPLVLPDLLSVIRAYAAGWRLQRRGAASSGMAP